MTQILTNDNNNFQLAQFIDSNACNFILFYRHFRMTEIMAYNQPCHVYKVFVKEQMTGTNVFLRTDSFSCCIKLDNKIILQNCKYVI